MDAFRSFFEFARLRPHHFSLALSPRFRADKEVAKRRGYIDEDLFVLATAWLDRRPSRRERELLRVLLYGGGLAVATGTTTVGAAMAAVNSALESSTLLQGAKRSGHLQVTRRRRRSVRRASSPCPRTTP